ncbi:alpha-1,2-fucosyltransferase [Jannaschia sp. 2305UL9-9]|uniref:alpha-1,2-fucosyltransferase n=1 Tax=Jannaschia sp. 2305UL9-9 TaxID=3121638 RepID=UPI0035291E13
MITQRLFGGLGNQMFQYATGRAVAAARGVPLALDTRDTDRRGGHNRFALHRYAIDVASDPALPPDRKGRPLRYAAWRAMGGRLLREAGLGFDPRVMQAPDGSYLHGYFQSERYFAGIADTIRRDLTLTEPLSFESAAWQARIAQDPLAVSLHVRRGDYLSAGNHGTCDAAYYARALQAVTDRMGARPRLYAFSDDPDWVRDHLHLDAEMAVVGHNGPDAGHEDLALMSTCRHHIVANSTFSWWGAWLNPRPDKVVAAPAVWFAALAQTNHDILPDSWIAV